MDRYFSFLRYLKLKNIQDRITYLRWYNFIEKAQWWSREESDKWQFEKIKLLLDYAYNNIPYYTELIKRIGATPRDIKTWEDFRKIPYLTKNIVRERLDDLISKQIKNKSKLKFTTTSGSTGEPLRFYSLPFNNAIGRAFMDQQWKRVGYNEKSSRILLKGEPLKNKKLFQRQRFTNNWQVSTYYLSKDFINQYIDFLNKIKPEFFHVHPSSLYIFTQLLYESKHKLNFNPKAILCGSEPVYDYQRQLFEKTYNARVYSWLGLAEGTTLAGECEFSSSLHVWPQYSYVELIDDNGLPVSEKGQAGSIIGTSFNILVSPFIRYRSGDHAKYGGDRCHLCGRQHMLFDRIEGREQDILILADSSEFSVSTLHYNINKFNAFRKIKMMQMIQNARGELLFKLSTTGDFTSEDESEIKIKSLSVVNNRLSVSFEYTDNFIRTKSGKNIFFIQRIKRDVD